MKSEDDDAAETPSEASASEPTVEANPDPSIPSVGLVTDSDMFDVLWAEELNAVSIAFYEDTVDGPKTRILAFAGPAAEKILTGMNVLVNLLLDTGVMRREGGMPFPVSDKKKETLH